MEKRIELFESLIRLGLMLIFMFSLTAGTFGLISICQMLMRSQIRNSDIAIYAGADSP
jgi:hypothetical protein